MELVDKLEHPDLNMQGKLQCPGNVPARDTIGDRWGEGCTRDFRSRRRL